MYVHYIAAPNPLLRKQACGDLFLLGSSCFALRSRRNGLGYFCNTELEINLGVSYHCDLNSIVN